MDKTLNILLLSATIFLNIIFYCYAHEDDIPFAEWMLSLKQPDNPVASCCGPVDQYYALSYEGAANGFTVRFINKQNQIQQISVPEEKVIYGINNPTGKGVLFISSYGQIFCFIPSNGV